MIDTIDFILPISNAPVYEKPMIIHEGIITSRAGSNTQNPGKPKVDAAELFD